MNRTFKRILAITCVVVLVMSMSMSAFAAGTVTPVTGTQTVYIPSSSGGSVNIGLAYGTKSFTINRSSVKVTAGTTGAKMVGFAKRNNSYSSNYQYNYSGSEWTTESYSDADYSYDINLQVSAKGTAKVTYKIGSTSYTTSVKVLAYTNPVKSITLNGVYSSKSFASLTKSSIDPSKDLTLSTKTTGARLKVTPASGWKIAYASIHDNSSGMSKSISSWNKGLSSVSLYWGTLYASHNYSIDIEYINTSNGATMSTYYSVFGKYAS